MKRILVTVVILASVGVVGAQEFNLPPGKWWDNERLATHIGLTETQREQIRTQVYEHAHRMIDLNAGVKKAELELANLVANSDFESWSQWNGKINPDPFHHRLYATPPGPDFI